MSEWLKRDPTNGMLVGPDCCHYKNEHQAAHFALLKLCGCGTPEDAYNFCRSALACFDRRGDEYPPTRLWIDAENTLVSLIKDRPDDAAHVLAHLLTNLNLLEHGGSVGSSWLTENGERIVDMAPMTPDVFEEGHI